MRITLPIGLCALVTLATLLCSCETEPASSPVQISPATATIRSGQSIQMTASGGYDFQWSLSSHTLGTLSVTTGPSSIYTSIYSGSGTNQVQEITVTSTIAGSSAGGSNTTAYTRSATAYITHL